MSLSLIDDAATQARSRAWAPLCVTAAGYIFFLCIGETLLQDSDTFWQIKIGQWILDHGALPYNDFYSFTRFGEPWISTSWLSQLLLAVSYAQLGWAGPVVLTSIAIALSAAVLVYRLDAHLETPRSVLFAMLALFLSLHHLLARPHILALPVMVAWFGALLAAAERRSSPSWLWLPLMTLWSSLHGGFVLGLALIGPVALEAVWSVEPDRRIALALRWMLFGVAALAASCCTPYGWRTLLGAANILDLGQLLSVISEWQPANFSTFTEFEGALLGLIALAFYRGITLSPPRIILVLTLIWMALTHVRSIEAFAFLVPLVLARSIGMPSTTAHTPPRGGDIWPARHFSALAGLIIAAAAWTSTSIYIAHHPFAFTAAQTPAAAVDVLKQHKAGRIFNAYQFGGYLISRNIPVFIDGRAELYGERFVMDFFKATEAREVENLLRMLDAYRIDATLLVANSPAAQVLDHIPGWKRVYADQIAVVHMRSDPTQLSAASSKEMPK